MTITKQIEVDIPQLTSDALSEIENAVAITFDYTIEGIYWIDLSEDDKKKILTEVLTDFISNL